MIKKPRIRVINIQNTDPPNRIGEKKRQYGIVNGVIVWAWFR